MVKFKNLFAGILSLSVGVFAFTSCMKDDPAPLNAEVDVMVQDIKTDNGVKYGITIYAIANYEINTATVTGPGTNGEIYQLVAGSDKHQFTFIPETDDYSDVMPIKGDYTFEITSVSNEKITGKDVLGEEKLTPIVIKSTSITNHILKTTWDKVTGANAYVVRLYNEDKSEVVFSSTLLADDKTEYEFGPSTQGWGTGRSPVTDNDYHIELLGIKFETGVTYDLTNNIQFITLDSKSITWE